MTQRLGCAVCHGADTKIVGPGFREVARKYGGRSDAVDYLTQKITAGGTGVWGPIPMPPQTLAGEEARAIAQWLANGAPR
jgi:cytochrome c